LAKVLQFEIQLRPGLIYRVDGNAEIEQPLRRKVRRRWRSAETSGLGYLRRLYGWGIITIFHEIVWE
jgi:hypothetical protein